MCCETQGSKPLLMRSAPRPRPPPPNAQQERVLKVNRTAVFKSRAAKQQAYFSAPSMPLANYSAYMFLQLQENLGWDFFQRSMFALHKPQNARQSLSRLAVEYSRPAGRDLSDFLSAWRLPVTVA